MTNNSSGAIEPVNQIPQKKKEAPVCKTLRGQFPFLWKLCLTYGVCYLLFAYRNIDGIGSGIFAGISAVFLLWIAKRLKDQREKTDEKLLISISSEAVFYFVAAVLISFGNCLTDNRFFLFFNHIGSVLLFSIACIKLFYNDRKWDFGKYTNLLFSYWIQILEVVPVPFQDFHFYHKSSKKKISPNTRSVLIGILTGLPVLFITTLLLASADQIFSDLIGRVFDFEKLFHWLFENLPQNIIRLPFSFCFYTLLLYLVIAALCKGGLKEQVTEPSKFGTAIAVTVFGMIDVVYLLFSGIQILFLFAGLPSGKEYAEYARQGFFELLFVALINFILVLFCNKHFEKNTILKVTMTITCLCTFVMIISSAYRMYMYIDVYHLTFLRVFVLWFLLMLSFFMAGSTVSVYKEDWNSFRYCLPIVTVFYLVFALSGVDQRIAEYNVAQFKNALQENLRQSQNDTVIPLLDNYLPNGYESSKAYAVVLYHLKKDYGNALGEENMELIDEYLQVSEHFYEYDYYNLDEDGEYEFVLEKYAAIYDKEQSESLFLWKHYNFVESTCYQKCKVSGNAN